METKEINLKDVWETFLSDISDKTFLESWNWGEFQKKMGNKIWRFGVFENEDLISIALIIKIAAKRGTFLFMPHGPVIKCQMSNLKCQILEELLRRLKDIVKQEKCSFIRIGPIWEKNEENIRIFKKLGFKEAPIHIHPELTWQLDITRPEEELLMGMRKTTRYLIRQGMKNKDIEIVKSKSSKDIEIFNELYQKTVNRHHFVPFSLNYLMNEFLAFLPDDQIVIFLGRYKKEIISSAIIIFWQGIAFYHQGASSLKYPKVPVSYLLQWETIKEAKKRSCKTYNFWGIAPENSPKHPWAGLTLFKMGFGGQKKEYLKTQDLPQGGGWVSSKKYYLTYTFEKLRKIKRGL
ncbi:MAG: hypothetical protein COS47_00820 [Candidatus Nealsonbacteria bacterium CG03_land_8_20_14_0_80_36_12]|uniref:BioF2-like acetyltransferase domain-containing protein n=1 Tax=Candidatus Nealsonbacteria bacterium CG03_land_8_20_14_0_80_36_12 TaxID=1974701 RepID=A0A2M7BYJ4_9BACT|nr:MAG: hypothetical protein COS47_00820 [Candidatus Nealsonbacteria bacterium CG03_land_8_20_14_0_80_36_12]